MNAYDRITAALSMVGFAAFGEAPEAEAVQLAMRVLNSMLGEWSTKPYYNPRQWMATAVAAGAPSLSLGDGGDFSTNPVDIRQVTLELGTTVWRVPLKTLQEYELMTVKTTPGVPQMCAWDRQEPLSRIYFWPIPIVGYTVRLVGIDAIPRLSTPHDTLDLPDWYDETVEYNLAKRLLPHMPGLVGSDMLSIIQATAATSMSGIRARNLRMRQTRTVSDFRMGGAGTYWTWPGRVV